MKKSMIPFIEIANLGYYKFAKGVAKHRTGYFYWFNNIEDTVKKGFTEKYNNVLFLSSHCQYAPEIKSSVLFVADTPFNAKFEEVREAPNVCYAAKIFNGCKMYSVTSISCKETETRYFHTKKEAETFIRKNFDGLQKQIRLNDLRCA